MVRTAGRSVATDAPTDAPSAAAAPPAAAGPSSSAAWVGRTLAAGGPAVAVMVLPDAANAARERAGAAGVFHTLLQRPAVWRGADGLAGFSLTLVLTRTPSPDDANVSPLVEHGILALDVRLSVPPDVQRETARAFGECHPIYARNATVDLIWTASGGERPVSVASATGAVLHTALSARLDRTQALDVLSALSGGASGFRVRGRIDFRAVDPGNSATTTRSVAFDARLDEILGGILGAGAADRYIHLISPLAGSPTALGPAPARVRPGPAARGAANEPQRLTSTGDGVKSLTLAMQPAKVTASAAALAASDLARPAAVAAVSAIRPQHWALDNAVFGASSTVSARSLPIVTAADAPIWRDRLKNNKYWYAPVLELVVPAPRAEIGTSPFSFTFTRTGATASGEPALSGVVKLTLKRTMPEATRAALRPLGNVQVQAVPAASLSIALEIPYVSSDTGRLKTTIVPSSP